MNDGLVALLDHIIKQLEEVKNGRIKLSEQEWRELCRQLEDISQLI